MRIVTIRDVIRTVVEKYKEQYGNKLDQATLVGVPRDILRNLEKLDLETATASNVVAITKNSSWVSLRCINCGKERTEVVAIFYLEDEIHLCESCLQNGLSLLKERQSLPEWV